MSSSFQVLELFEYIVMEDVTMIEPLGDKLVSHEECTEADLLMSIKSLSQGLGTFLLKRVKYKTFTKL